MKHGDMTIGDILRLAPVIPVVIIEDAADAVPLARALVAGGLPVIEVTLRTKAGLEAIRAIAAEVPEAVVGVGTVLDAAQFTASIRAGARFAVAPGATDRLLDAVAGSPVTLLPGIATASEAMRLIERGYHYAKLFPAEAVGGIKLLGALASPLPQLMFCPTGGITPELAPLYLRLPNVVCVGGSWMVTPKLIAGADWAGIAANARSAAALRNGAAP